MDRDVALDHVERIVGTVESVEMPVPVREVWVYGDVALGLDPVERLEVYVTKDLLLRDEAPDREAKFREDYGVRGVGRTVRADWAEAHPELLRTNDAGYAAPEQCLAAQLLPDGVEAHLEVCNTGFEANVTQRLEGAAARGAYEVVLDPRGVCLWAEGARSPTALHRLRAGDLVFPTLVEALGMLGLEPTEAERAASAVRAYRDSRSGTTVRGDVV